jgi:hypothetical protein
LFEAGRIEASALDQYAADGGGEGAVTCEVRESSYYSFMCST